MQATAVDDNIITLSAEQLQELHKAAKEGRLEDSKQNRRMVLNSIKATAACFKKVWLEDFSRFTRECLGLYVEPFHAEWQEIRLHPEYINEYGRYCVGSVSLIREFVLAPRGFGKSKIRNTAFVVWLILRNINYRILVVSETADNAKNFLGEVKDIFENNKMLRLVFGDYTGGFSGNSTKAGNVWSTTRIEVAIGKVDDSGNQYWERRSVEEKEPTVNTMGVLNAGTGLHYDVIICDDIVSMKNCRTEGMRKTKLDWFNNTLLPMVQEPHGFIMANGTRYHPQDLYHEWMKQDGLFHNPKNAKKEIIPEEQKTFIYKAIITEKVEDAETGNVIEVERSLWERFRPLAKLQLRRKHMGPVAWNAQMLNSVEAMRGAILQPDWIEPIVLDTFDVNDPHLIWIAGTDPSWTKHDVEKNAMAGYCLMALDPDWNIYVWNVRKWHPNFKEYTLFLYNEALNMNLRGTPLVGLFFEENSLQNCVEADVRWIDTLGITPLEGIQTQSDKTTRFLAKQGLFWRKQVFVHPNLMKGDDCFFNDLLSFPNCETKDGVDAWMLAIEGAQRTFAYMPNDDDIYADDDKIIDINDEVYSPGNAEGQDIFELIDGERRSVI